MLPCGHVPGQDGFFRSGGVMGMVRGVKTWAALAGAGMCSPSWGAVAEASASLGVGDALAAVSYLGAAALMGLAWTKGERAEDGADKAARRRDAREMAVCAAAALALMLLPGAVLSPTLGLGENALAKGALEGAASEPPPRLEASS
jgi:hypothetical protein